MYEVLQLSHCNHVTMHAEDGSGGSYSGLQLTFCRSWGRGGVGGMIGPAGSRLLSCSRLTTLRASGVLPWRLSEAREELIGATPSPPDGCNTHKIST